MRLRAALTVLLFLAAASALLAQSPADGTWTDSMFGLVLHANSNRLNGRVKEGQLDAHPLLNGIVDGRNIQFATNATLNGKDVVIEWKGDFIDDALTLTRLISSNPPKRPYPPFNGPFILHRSK